MKEKLRLEDKVELGSAKKRVGEGERCGLSNIRTGIGNCLCGASLISSKVSPMLPPRSAKARIKGPWLTGWKKTPTATAVLTGLTTPGWIKTVTINRIRMSRSSVISR